MRIIKSYSLCFFICSMFLCTVAFASAGLKEELEALKQKHIKYPDEFVYVLEIGKKYKQAGDFTEAIVWFQKSLDLDKDNTESLLYLGILYAWTNDYSKAVVYLKKCLLIAPTHDDAKLTLARVYSWQEKRKEAITLASEVIEHNPDYSDAYILKAKILLWEKDYDEAGKIYQDLIIKDANFLEAHLGLMDIDAALKNYDAAIIRGKQLLVKFPDNLPLYRSLGKIYSWKGDYDDSLFWLDKALGLAPDDKQVEVMLMRVYRWSGRYGEGIGFQQKILADNPHAIDAIKEIAHLYELSGDEESAIKWYEKALDTDMDNSEIQARLGFLYSRTSRINDSINALKKSIEVDSNDIESLITLGRAYSWSQEIEESIKLYKRALELEPKNQEAYLGLGRSYYYNGQWAEASEAFEQVLSVDPLRKEAIEALAKIELLRKPHLTTAFDSFLIRNYQPSLGSYDQRIENISLSQDVDIAFSSDFSVGLQYKQISEKEDGLGGSVNYRFKGQEYAFKMKKTFLSQFSLLTKIVSGFYGNDGGDVLFAMDEDKDLVSGFALLKYSYDKFQLNLIYSKEVVYPIIQGPDFNVGYFRDIGVSAGYSFLKNMNLFLFYYDRKYYDDRKRYERQAELRYKFPFYEKIEIFYSYKNLTSPNEEIYNGGLVFRDRIDAFSYLFKYSLEDNSFENIKIHEFNLFCSYAFKDSCSLNGDITYSKERESDRDETTDFKIYAVYHF